MFNIICTTDPISGKDLKDISKLPHVVEGSGNGNLNIYFESEATRKAYLDIPVQRPATEHRLNLDNPTEVFIDEG